MTTTTPANAPRRRAIQDGLPSKLGAANTDTYALYPEFMYTRQRRPTQLDVVPYKRGCRASLAPPTPTHPHYTRSSCIRDHCHPRQAPPDRLRDHCHPLLHSPSRSPPLQHQYFERSIKMDQGGREDRGDVQDRYFPDLPLRILMGKP